MDESNELLRKYANSKRKYFDLPEGEEVKVTYLGAELVPNHFDNGKTTCIRYSLEVDGVLKYWDRVSAELAKQMSVLKKGDIIFISKSGEKNKTKYSIRKEAK